ncbi:MAG: 3-oxoacyl-ACP synthase [Brevundimonas sp.]|nr:MAG: 3-oxoacyl-ACP synthase [Brevundimonas sp.]
MIRFSIAGRGVYRPRTQMPSTALDARFGRTEGSMEAEFGIASRGVAAPDETTSMMAVQAARMALDSAGWADGAFDALIGGCGVMEQPIPSTAILVQQGLGLGRSGIPAFDVNQTCLSFMAALDVAAMGIALGRWRRVLVFSSDIASAGLDPTNAKISAIFGDGAAAVAIEAGDGEAGLLASRFESYGDGAHLATLRAGGTRLRVEEGYDALVEGARFHMDAFGIFKAAAKRLPPLIDRVLADAGVTRDDLTAVVCHQASGPGLAHLERMFAPRPERVVNIFSTHGNQIAASLPTALAHVLDTGRAGPGDVVLMLGTAAGISTGAMVLRL